MENYEKEKAVNQFLSENNISSAVPILFDLILSHANAGDFLKAEELREKLMAVDSMALHEIIKSGEIIEQLQADAIDKKHLELWSGLYDMLNKDEKNKLFYASREMRFGPNEVVLEQESSSPFLYLVDEGKLKMSCRLKNKEIMVKKLGPGDFAGDDTFLSFQAFSSVSLIAESDVKIRKLPKESFAQWSNNLPGLCSKLTDYLLKAGTTEELLKTMKLSRRIYDRIPLPGNGRFQFMDNKGKALGSPVKGSLLDISMGGMSFAMRITKKETARMILGRKLNAQFGVMKDQEPVSIDRSGIIVSVGEYNLDDYALHMKFDLLLDEVLIKAVKDQHSNEEYKKNL
ncbi:MAG: Crp/Fnr family transcriptional regulator [Desulfobacteraceae bacterium]|nr:Crp/Fnr family transcriptional regulator [Desulfobacteraceae bacterium]MBU4001047.1 Crp/Fnr family transcriptional regulator [Pseudomonadota bacterium]MBU4054830.1 Crp/Fnr family transcriptional regulator [Pseudomonadota bacterium]